MPADGRGGSALAIDEWFEAGDSRFLEEVLASRADSKLAALADRWYRDGRPFARQALLAYALDGCDRPRHRPLVKRLFKAAEAAGDDELLGCFLVAFDRLTRRDLVERRRWDWQARTTSTDWVLREDGTVPGRDRGASGKTRPARPRYTLDRFSRRTRRHLARRALRYFRRLGRADPARYRTAALAALRRYRDEHLQKPQHVLDAWGLVHLLWWGSRALARRPRGVALAPGHTLGELAPAPLHAAVWRGQAEALLQLAVEAGSRTVRGWALALLERDEADALRGLPVVRLRALLASPHEEVQTFAARRLRGATGLESLPLADWLSLLELDNPVALPILCELVVRHVAPERLTLDQAVRLASARMAPVAELGWRWVRSREVRSAADLAALLPLCEAGTARVRGEAAGWLAGLVGQATFATPLHLRELLDARHAEVRAPALAALAATPRLAADLGLWAALAESPHADVREHLVRHLEGVVGGRRDALPPGAVQHVCATALLSVHRGGRAKRQVAAQVARRIVEAPAEAPRLLPLLGVVLRSVRPPERRAALAALARAAFERPSLRADMAAALPELRLLDAEVA